jgi:phage terminase small subunit
MPILQNSRHEAFAQARARGAGRDEAYKEAGFAGGNDHAWRLEARAEVAGRIAELRAARPDLSGADVESVIAALLRMAKASEALETPAGGREARLTLVEACRLSAQMAHDRDTGQRKADI